ncbi:MAG: SDR family oxidoreductase, partial [Acidobacteria bacterium]|nr:SDR family oxidoreductase [Acidobacteriota bacterium]
MNDSSADSFHLRAKIAVVTGGGSGIGAAIARRFAANGATIWILDLHLEAANMVVGEITRRGGKANAYECDVADWSSVRSVFAEVFRQSRVHILVNNAGVAHVGNVENTGEEDFERIFRVNVKGFYNCMHACVAHMKTNGGGVILNLASIAASVGLADRFAYSMSKGAVVSMTYSVAHDYLRDNIRCNSISPARVHTPFVDGFIARNYAGREEEMFDRLSKAQPIGRMAAPDEVAAL